MDKKGVTYQAIFEMWKKDQIFFSYSKNWMVVPKAFSVLFPGF